MRREGIEPHASAAEVLRRVAEIEEESRLFYVGLRDNTKNEWVHRFADELMKAEIRHRDRFYKYAARAEAKAADKGRFGGECPEKVMHLLATRILPTKEQIAHSAPYASDREAIQLAIRAEEHIALLLTEVREYMLQDEKKYIDRVIKEEWGHHARLQLILRNHIG